MTETSKKQTKIDYVRWEYELFMEQFPINYKTMF